MKFAFIDAEKAIPIAVALPGPGRLAERLLRLAVAPGVGACAAGPASARPGPSVV